VFVRSGTEWTRQAKLTASDEDATDWFGYSVALSGDTAVVGAPYDDTPSGADAGSAHVFTRTGTTWAHQAPLTAPDGIASDFFGYSVAVDGDTAVVGAPYDLPAGTQAGRAYVFGRSGTTWVPQARLTAPDGIAYDRFGYSVAVRATTAVVGVPYDDTMGGADAGSAYVFGRRETGWTLRARLTASDGEDYDEFGWSVAMSADAIVLGAKGDTVLGATAAGSAYVVWP